MKVVILLITLYAIKLYLWKLFSKPVHNVEVILQISNKCKYKNNNMYSMICLSSQYDVL